MKPTITQSLLEYIKLALAMDTKTIFHVNDNYFLKKEQKQKERFALEFVNWCKDLEYDIYFDTKYKIKEFVKDTKHYENI